jgi:hypothetical protein
VFIVTKGLKQEAIFSGVDDVSFLYFTSTELQVLSNHQNQNRRGPISSPFSRP